VEQTVTIILRLEGGTDAVKHGHQPVYGLRLVFGLIVSFPSWYTVKSSSSQVWHSFGIDICSLNVESTFVNTWHSHNRVTCSMLHFMTGLSEVPEAILSKEHHGIVTEY
jgi:hypothetical protein